MTIFQVKKLIMDENVSVKFEDNAYKAVVKWIKHDLEERKAHLGELMSHVRLPFVRPEFLRRHIITEPLLRSDQECSQVLIEALNYQLTPVSERNSLCQFKTNRNEKFHVLLAGGRIKTPQNISKIYNVSGNKTFPIQNMLDCRHSNSAIFLNGFVYSVGGHGRKTSINNSGTKILNTAERYDWYKEQNNGFVYSVGGHGRKASSHNSGMKDLKTAERYDTYKKQWIYISPMSIARRNFGICTYNDRIYVIGGNQVSSVESYDPVTNLWTKCANTPATYDNGNRAAVVGNSIYSMGRDASLIRLDPREGRWNNLDKASRDLQTEFELVSYDVSLFCIGSNCQRFDVRTHKWEPMPSMLSKLNGRSAVMIADDIYLIGWKKIERYNIHDNEWVIVDSTALEFYDGGAAVMSDYS